MGRVKIVTSQAGRSERLVGENKRQGVVGSLCGIGNPSGRLSRAASE